MQVICTDGTVFECQAYEIRDPGVVLFGEVPEETDERYEREKKEIGYVPHHRLEFILPDGVVPASSTRSLERSQQVTPPIMQQQQSAYPTQRPN